MHDSTVRQLICLDARHAQAVLKINKSDRNDAIAISRLRTGWFKEFQASSKSTRTTSARVLSLASVVWTTDSGSLGAQLLTSGFGELMHTMFDSENDSKLELEWLRLASDLKQLANETLNPDLKAHCLRMAKEWSGEAHEPAKD